MNICTAVPVVAVPWTPNRVYRLRSFRFRPRVDPYVRAVSETTTEESTMTRTSDDVIGLVVTPSVVNKPWFRVTALLGTVFIASTYFQQPLPDQILKTTHLFAFSAWFGSSVWAILISPMIMFKTLGRQTFGRLQSKLFPQFFGLSVACLVVLLGTRQTEGIPYALILGLMASLINWLVFEPIISARTTERYALENAETKDEERIKALVKINSRYHGLSSMAGLIAICCACAQGIVLASALSF